MVDYLLGCVIIVIVRKHKQGSNNMVNGFTLGQKVTWSSAAGQLVGFIKGFNKGLNGHKEMVNWVTIQVPVNLNPGSGITNPDYTAHFAVASFPMLKVRAV